MKTQRTPDGITWEGLPSLFRELVPPQSGARFGESAQTQTFCAPAAFWRKLAQSLRDPAVRALWQPRLGKGNEYVGEGRLDSEMLGSPKRDASNRNTPNLETFTAEAAPGFGDLLRESLRQPLLLADVTDAGITCARLLLSNGATAIVRVDSNQVTLQDCFFTRPARECPAAPADSPSRHQAAVRGMILRHAGFDVDPTRRVPARTHPLPGTPGTPLGLPADPATTSFRNGAASNRRAARFNASPESTRLGELLPSRPDAAACLDELSAAIAHLEAAESTRVDARHADDSTLQLAAYRLAAALGYCRLFGCQPADASIEYAVPARLLPPVIRELTSRLNRWVRADFSHGDRPSSLWADEDHFAGLFESRMEAWAVFVEIDVASGPSFIGSDAAAPVDAEAFDALLAALESFDATLQSREPEWLAAAPRLIANCRLLLAPRYRECAPWWLCESLSPLAT